MKALTIKEPWATLIIDKYKKYEFRGWKTNYRGKILIHAGKSIEKDMLKRFKDYNLNCSFGEIIGEAELTECILVDEKFNQELRNIDEVVYGRSNHVEKYALHLENVRKYKKKIPINGKLGLWNYEVTTHYLRLDDEYFNKIKEGTKKIELRLNDEKRRKIYPNDIIEFTNRENGDTLKTKVVDLHIYKSFEDLYSKFSKELLGYSKNEIADPRDMEKYYSRDEQQTYGVVGIEVELI